MIETMSVAEKDKMAYDDSSMNDAAEVDTIN